MDDDKPVAVDCSEPMAESSSFSRNELERQPESDELDRSCCGVIDGEMVFLMRLIMSSSFGGCLVCDGLEGAADVGAELVDEDDVADDDDDDDEGS